MRRFYRILLYAYPPCFRRRFGREMEQAFADRCRAIAQTSGLRGLLVFGAQIVADWILTSVHERFTSMPIPDPVSDGAVGAPVFYTCETSAPSQRALVNGAFLSLAIFALVFSLIGHVEDLPVPLLPGSGPPPYSPQPFPTRSSAMPDPPSIGPAAVLAALDTNHDGVISPTEIAQAPVALGKLDQNYDGKLNAQECGADPRLPFRARLAYMRGNPLLAALDANHDGEISSTEIQRAPEALATLDKNHDGQLTKDELHETTQIPLRVSRARLALSDKRSHSRRQA